MASPRSNPTPTEERTCMALSTGKGGVEQRDPEITSPVAGNVVGPT